jgi:hypothetical protein
MIKTRICPECGQLLTKAANALRQHETDMLVGLRLNTAGDLTEELRQKLAPEVVTSFNAARAAWDAYTRHLDGHGLLEPALRGQDGGLNPRKKSFDDARSRQRLCNARENALCGKTRRCAVRS